MSKKKKTVPEEHPSADAFLTNPVASVNDCTGYVQIPPEIEMQAKAYSDLTGVPCSKSAAGKRRKKGERKQ